VHSESFDGGAVSWLTLEGKRGGKQVRVVVGLLGVHPSAVHCLSRRFPKDPNGNFRDL
jgi:hypothetical protein